MSSSNSNNDDTIVATTTASSSTAVATAVVILLVTTTLLACYYYKQKQPQQDRAANPSSSSNDDNNNNHTTTIPVAPHAIPFLGHALLYKQDPVGFLRQCSCNSSSSSSPLFQLNLAGKHMILVSCGNNPSLQVQRQLATLPESVLSARQAVANMGFEQTLGPFNVHVGTSLHKGIVKQQAQGHGGSGSCGSSSVWIEAMRDALDQEVVGVAVAAAKDDNASSKTTTHVDLFLLIRRVMLRTTIDVMIGKSFLHAVDNTNTTTTADDDDFVQDYMNFQDALEDVTAKAVLLPKPLALLFLLWPLQRRRIQLQQRIVTRLERMRHRLADNANNDHHTSIGFWLHAVWKDHPEYTTAQIAEFIVGLLFAAHKNPAIGAAQSLLMLHTELTAEEKAQCQQEAKQLLQSSDNNTSASSSSSCPLLHRVCLETLRLTAHTIGAVRTAQQDVTVTVNHDGGGATTTYTIPKGSTVAFSHIIPNTNASIWGNNGARKNDDNATTAAATKFSLHHPDALYRDEYAFTTFSHGVHKCPGQKLAVEVLMVGSLALLLVEYDVAISIDDDDTVNVNAIPPLSFERATLAQREGPVMVTLRRRSPKTVGEK